MLEDIKTTQTSIISPNDFKSFWDNINNHCDRVVSMIHWMIDGKGMNNVTSLTFPNITPEIIEDIYNVKF